MEHKDQFILRITWLLLMSRVTRLSAAIPLTQLSRKLELQQQIDAWFRSAISSVLFSQQKYMMCYTRATTAALENVGILQQIWLRNHWGYVADVSKYHTVGIYIGHGLK